MCWLENFFFLIQPYCIFLYERLGFYINIDVHECLATKHKIHKQLNDFRTIYVDLFKVLEVKRDRKRVKMTIKTLKTTSSCSINVKSNAISSDMPSFKRTGAVKNLFNTTVDRDELQQQLKSIER